MLRKSLYRVHRVHASFPTLRWLSAFSSWWKALLFIPRPKSSLILLRLIVAHPIVINLDNVNGYYYFSRCVRFNCSIIETNLLTEQKKPTSVLNCIVCFFKRWYLPLTRMMRRQFLSFLSFFGVYRDNLCTLYANTISRNSLFVRYCVIKNNKTKIHTFWIYIQV